MRRALVIDADLGADDNQATKDAGREHVSLVLDSFGIPHVHHDGRSGYHTWIRLDCDAAPEERAALAALLNSSWTGDGTFQVFPHGGTALRLPFGLYCGRPRGAVPQMGSADALAWLRAPKRASEEQLRELVRTATPSAPDPEPAVQVEPAPAQREERITGWNSWPECKRARATSGPLPGMRHHTLLMLACEAVESGERDETRLAEWLASLPRPHSATSAAAHEADARYAARDALRLYAANDPRRFSSCPHVPRHSGHPATTQHRATFEDECTLERAAACPIFLAWQRGQNLPAWTHVLRSSIWRSGRGNGSGIGVEARAVYKEMLRRSGGDPELVFPASHRWIAIRLLDRGTHVDERSVPKIVDRLVAEGLVEEVDGGRGLYRIPFRTPAWIAQKEAKLGTDAKARRARNDILRHWQQNEHLRS